MKQRQKRIADVLFGEGWLTTNEITQRYKQIHGEDINPVTLRRAMGRMRKREDIYTLESRRSSNKGKNAVEYCLSDINFEQFSLASIRDTKYQHVVAYMNHHSYHSFKELADKFNLREATVQWLANRYDTLHNYTKQQKSEYAREINGMHQGKIFKLSETMLKFDDFSSATEILKQYKKDHGEEINHQSFGSCLRLMYRQPACFGLKKVIRKNQRHYKMLFVSHDNYKGEIDGNIHDEVLSYMQTNSFSTFSQVAQKFGVSSRAVSRLAQQHGLYENHTNYDKIREQNERVVKKGMIWMPKASSRFGRLKELQSRDENGKLTWLGAHRLMNQPRMQLAC